MGICCVQCGCCTFDLPFYAYLGLRLVDVIRRFVRTFSHKNRFTVPLLLNVVNVLFFVLVL